MWNKVILLKVGVILAEIFLRIIVKGRWPRRIYGVPRKRSIQDRLREAKDKMDRLKDEERMKIIKARIDARKKS